MKKMILVMCIIGSVHQLRSQDFFEKKPKFIYLPDNFSAENFYLFRNDFIGIWGYYRNYHLEKDDTSYYAAIYQSYNSKSTKFDWHSTADTVNERDSVLRVYYNQLTELKLDYATSSFFLFTYNLNYIFKIEGSRTSLDSIPQASGINDLLVCKDSLLYASITNQNKNYIVRKKGDDGNWKTLPVLISQPEKFATLNKWFVISIIGCCFLGIYLIMRLKKKGEEIKTITEEPTRIWNDLKLQADKPLDYEDMPDGDMKDCVNAIVQVIKNRNTPLPMTVAINGAWGSGKSSIMNCMRQQLDKDTEERFITTWFNTWHQQTESSLLDAFLLKIINRYEKPFFKNNWQKAFFSFIRFRFNLASSRFIKWPALNKFISGFALAFLILIITIIIINIYGYANNPFFTHNGLLNINIATLFSVGEFSSVQTITSIIALLLSIGSFFILKSESTPTLGAFLNVIYKKTFLVDAEKNAPDFREKFRTQYWEMMEAVEDRVLVVFIDDLDRVNGDKIFDMLEAINFIGDVTSRPIDSQKDSLKTVFVLGLYVDQVAESLGTYLQKENPFASKDPIIAKAEAILLGKRYLEKMIQLNVPVPLTN